jgi:hypothetical protein
MKDNLESENGRTVFHEGDEGQKREGTVAKCLSIRG